MWSGVSERVQLMASPSKTGAYRDYASSRRRDLAEMARQFQPIDGQVGFVAIRDDRLDGVEAVGDPAVYAQVHDRLLHAYTIDAIEGGTEPASEKGVEFLTPEDFLGTIASSAYESGPSLGQGTDLRLRGEEVSGCALECGASFI